MPLLPILTTGMGPRGWVKDHKLRSDMESMAAASRAVTASLSEVGRLTLIGHPLPTIGVSLPGICA